ncbi:unnamed protein product [Linum tenue]|uniref:Uncharacterized protein n=1 Tax=Linum tenue TaxID=586396 RepID=A0AAV0JGY4_9ROSI|nr:unnamed protein product [Linum tenue]
MGEVRRRDQGSREEEPRVAGNIRHGGGSRPRLRRRRPGVPRGQGQDQFPFPRRRFVHFSHSHEQQEGYRRRGESFRRRVGQEQQSEPQPEQHGGVVQQGSSGAGDDADGLVASSRSESGAHGVSADGAAAGGGCESPSASRVLLRCDDEECAVPADDVRSPATATGHV